MGRTSKQLLYWAPRALGIAFAIFISLFALDAFSTNLPFGKQLLAFAVHLIPTYLIILVLALAWKREWLGTAGFIALGTLSMWRYHSSVYLVISGPAFLIGMLFLADWIMGGKLRCST